MSNYTDYEKVAATGYDATRLPVGVEVFEGVLRQFSPDSYEETSILDLGCGTGTFPEVLLKAGLKSAVLVDGSHKMLEICDQKMAAANITNCKTQHVVLPNLDSFKNDEFSAVTSMMVLHHLPQGGDWSAVSETIMNGAKKLKSGGVMVIGWQQPIQLTNFWFSHLVPENRAKVASQCPTIAQMIEWYTAAGLEIKSTSNIMMPVSGKTYYDAAALLTDENAWAQDSVMSGATASERESAMNLVKSLHAQNKLDQFVLDNDKIPIYGAGTILAGIKK